MLRLGRVPSPIGTLVTLSSDDALVLLEFEDAVLRVRRGIAAARARFSGEPLVENGDRTGAAVALRAYFAGDLTALDELVIDAGGSVFQRRVWALLRAVPAGGTTSYGTLARRLGMPGCGRAVGLANGANPIAIVVPCHRVIGTDGSLTGYGGGIARKRWLLEHEHARLPLASWPPDRAARDVAGR